MVCRKSFWTFENDIRLVAEVRDCTMSKDLQKGSKLHADALKRGLLETNRFVGNTLVNMYAKCGDIAKAQELFDKLPIQDIVTWTALVIGYAECGNYMKSIMCFEQIQQEGLSPDAVIVASIVKVCGSLRAHARGKEFHAKIAASGLLRRNVMLGNVLVDMYVKWGELAEAQQVLDELPLRNVVSWTTLITGYCQHEHGEEALICFERMKYEGHSPNPMTLACILKACGVTGQTEKGEAIHVEILRKGLLEGDIVLGNAVVDMYAKYGDLVKAYEVFSNLRARDIFSWNALLAGYVHHGQAEEALNCFKKMKHGKCSPDAVTFVCALKACGAIGAIEKGFEVHAEILRKQLQGKGIVLGNALVDMYAKCGALIMARQVFDELPAKDIVTWTALISGFCELGHGLEALCLFERMKVEAGFSPNAITFACILRACSSIGATERGQSYFDSMSTKYGISPTSEHHACMVSLYGHAGYFEEAMAMIEKMPSSDYLPAWSALIGASCRWGDINSGRLAFKNSLQLDDKSSLAYVRMSSILVSAYRQ
ncbi:hypothetical protein KP509_36G053200 [Ceratopteris richardii]|nr:hypothetical protein KP509_36G053200 [Ceratopteris richardii]